MNICKKIISTICASVFAFSCFGFNTNAEEIVKQENELKCAFECYNSSYHDNFDPFVEVSCITELIFEDTYTYTYRLVSNENVDIFMFWQRSEKKTAGGRTANAVNARIPVRLPSKYSSYLPNSSNTIKLNTLYKSDNECMYGFSYDETKDSYVGYDKDVILTQSSGNFSTNRPFVYTGDVIYECKIHVQTADFPILDYQSINYVKEKLMPMKVDTTNATLLDVEAENMRIREEANSYKAMDFDGDGLLTNADAQMILVYYTDSLVGKTTGKVEDYSEYVKQISG